MNAIIERLGLAWISALRQQEADFFAEPRGQADGRRRAELVDRIVRELFAACYGETRALGLAAVGGYGRGELFPCSDIDLLVLMPQPPGAAEREQLRVFLQSLWDANLRVSHSLRLPAECGVLQAGNLEFTISLLDIRPLVGNAELAESVEKLYLPRLIRRRRRQLQGHLRQLIAERHARYADTVYHLEPNVKESPGGLRDLQAAGWWRALADTEDRLLPAAERWKEDREEARQAQEFLAQLRTFLHYVQGRDINLLHYDLQDRLARELHPQHQEHTPEAWMRAYFRHARAIARRLRRTLYERRGAWLGRRRWKLAGGWQVRDGELQWHNGATLALPDLTAALLAGCQYRLQLAPAAEQAIHAMLPVLRRQAQVGDHAWQALRPLLLSPLVYPVLSELHELGLLGALLPEFNAVEGWVQRDFHHRYTVDEHTLLTLRALRELDSSRSETRRRLAELYTELEHPERLMLALLLHDLTKPFAADHIEAGARQAEIVAARWHLGRLLPDGI